MNRIAAVRTGLRICGRRGDPAVRDALIRFARWLRGEYEFPLRVPVYLSPHKFLLTMDGVRVSATCFVPWDRTVEPYIRIATGDYSASCARRGRDNALAGFLVSLAHEVIHYQQWIATGDVWEHGVNRQASAMVKRYARTVDSP